MFYAFDYMIYEVSIQILNVIKVPFELELYETMNLHRLVIR